MSWLNLSRRPEPEAMEDSSGVEAYASAAAQAHLDAIDNTLIEQALALGIKKGKALDVGTGPGSIALKIARRCPGLRMVGVDRSMKMIQTARRAATDQGLQGQVDFCVADAARLGFPDASFDFVLSNSLLHHLQAPVAALNEMARVIEPQGIVLLRDLRRPSRFTLAAHVAWHGRRYWGQMKELYEASVRAAYTPKELQELVQSSALSGGRVFLHHRTHLGILWDNRPRRRRST